MEENVSAGDPFGSERISRILLKIAPPVMLAQLIQAFYNIVDSFFVGKFSNDALTALTVIYPLQLIIIALAVGTGIGVNTYMARKFALNESKAAYEAAGTGMVLSLVSWAVFAFVSTLIMRTFVMTSVSSPAAVEYAIDYGNIVCIGSIGVFLEGNWSKVHQARGNMKLPMAAQIAGAMVNVVLDPVLIFGMGPLPGLGIKGAAYATILGQSVAAVITGITAFHKPPSAHKMCYYAGRIYRYGYSSIVMRALYTVYIVTLNMILAGFSDAAVTVLGLYYKLQSFFFIPLLGLQTCIIPILSSNYAQRNFSRCKQTMQISIRVSTGFMLLGIACFVLLPEPLIRLFSDSALVIEIGKTAFPIIGCSFICAVFSLIMPVFFQAIGQGATSLMLSLTRQIFCLIPIFWLLSLMGLNYTWFAFTISETIAGCIGFFLYRRQLKKWNV